MRSPSFVFGYHGCDATVGNQILARQNSHVRLSANNHDWLGHGAYFWEDSPGRAMDWAKDMKERKQTKAQNIVEPFVVGAIINLGNFLEVDSLGGFGDRENKLRNPKRCL